MAEKKPTKTTGSSKSSSSGVMPGGTPGAPDRVWFTCEAKLNIGNYESMGCSIGMSSDVREKETPEKAIERINSICIAELESKIMDIRASTAPKDGFSKGGR